MDYIEFVKEYRDLACRYANEADPKGQLLCL